MRERATSTRERSSNLKSAAVAGATTIHRVANLPGLAHRRGHRGRRRREDRRRRPRRPRRRPGAAGGRDGGGGRPAAGMTRTPSRRRRGNGDTSGAWTRSRAPRASSNPSADPSADPSRTGTTEEDGCTGWTRPDGRSAWTSPSAAAPPTVHRIRRPRPRRAGRAADVGDRGARERGGDARWRGVGHRASRAGGDEALRGLVEPAAGNGPETVEGQVMTKKMLRSSRRGAGCATRTRWRARASGRVASRTSEPFRAARF